MNYYTVPAIQKQIGTRIVNYPDIPDGVDWVGNIGSDGEYLIATNADLPAKTGRTKQLPYQALQNACNAKGIPFDDVYNKWYVG